MIDNYDCFIAISSIFIVRVMKFLVPKCHSRISEAADPKSFRIFNEMSFQGIGVS